MTSGSDSTEMVTRTRSAEVARSATIVDPFASSSIKSHRVAPSMGAFWRQRWLMAGVALIVITGGLSAIWTGITPVYRAKATVEVLPSNPRVLYRTEDNGVLPYHQQFLNSQPGVIRGVTVLKRVLERPDVQSTQWYKEPKRNFWGEEQSRLSLLRDAVSAEPRGGTYLVDLSVPARDRKDAELLTNALVDEYLAFARERSQESADVVYQRLKDQRRSLEEEIERRKEANRDLQRSLGSGAPTDAVSRRKAWVDERKSKLEETQRQLALSEWQERELAAVFDPPAGAQTDDGGSAPRTKPQYMDDAEWRRIYFDLRTARRELETNPRQLGPNHPEIVALSSRATFLEEMLKEQEKRIEDAARSGAGRSNAAAAPVFSGAAELASLRRTVGRLRKEQELLEQEIARREHDYETTFSAAEELTRENNALRYAEEKLDLVRRRIDEKETESGVSMAIRPVAAAFAPSEPDQDRRVLLSAAVIIAGIAAAVGLAYLRIILAPQIGEATDVPGVGHAPFLGMMPLLKSVDAADEIEMAAQIESVRVLRTALLERMQDRAGSAVLITSAGPGAGKTTVACLLARSLAQIGKKVLLVDADLHNPSVGARFELPPRPGLTELLIGDVEDVDAITSVDGNGLNVVTAGEVSNAVNRELLASGRFRASLKRWKENYDVILLDSSPVLPVADALIVSREVDGAMMIVRERLCRRADVSEAMSSLLSTGARIFGTVFIGERRLEHYSYRYGGATEREISTALDVRGN